MYTMHNEILFIHREKTANEHFPQFRPFPSSLSQNVNENRCLFKPFIKIQVEINLNEVSFFLTTL